MGDIWLVRHGQAGEVMGDYDRLSERGFAQSRLAGERWRHLTPVTHTVQGAMRRHRETAEAFAEGFGGLPDPVEDAAWNEFDHKQVILKAIEGGLQPPTERSRAGFSSFFFEAMGRWADGEFDADYDEPYSVFQSRVVAGFERLHGRLGKGETALVFTSGGAISAVARHLLGLAPRRAFQINTVLVNTGFTRVRVGRGMASLSSLNVHSHFDDAPELLTLS